MKMKRNVTMRVTILVCSILTLVCSFELTLYPSTSCYQEHGDMILKCIVSDQNTTNVKFQFKSRDRPDVVYELNSTSVSSNAVETRIPNVTVQNNVGTYFCRRDDEYSRQITYIEEKVVLPDDVLCYFCKSQGSLESVTCEWMGDNSTCWNLSIVTAGLGYYVDEQTCNVSMTCDEFSPLANCIRARYRTKMKMSAVCPVSSVDGGKFDLKLTGMKLTSTASQIIHKLIDCSIVKLQISDAQTQNVSGTQSVLVWRTTSCMERDCDCRIQCVVKTNDLPHTTVTQRCSSDTLFETVLRNLQEMTQYRTVVRCTTVGSGVWSDEEDVNFTTPLEAPSGGQLVGPGGYNMYVCQERFYCLVLYWRDTKGKVSKYQISVSNQTKKFDFEVPSSPMSQLRIPRTSDCQQFDVSVYGVNSGGISRNGTLLRVKDQSCAIRQSIGCTVQYNQSYDGYQVSTDVNSLCLEKTGCDVTYFWCQGIRNMSHVECENFVWWTTDELNESITFISLHENDRGLNNSLYIGASVSYYGQTTGIDWSACKDNVAKVISRTGSASAVSIIIPCVVCIVIVVATAFLCARRGLFKEKFRKMATICFKKHVTSVEHFQSDHLTRYQSEAHRRESSDLQQHTQTLSVSIISGSTMSPLEVVVESPDHYQELDFSALVIDLDDSSQGSQTTPESTRSITPDVNTSDAIQSQDSVSITSDVNTSDSIQSQISDYVGLNDLTFITSNGEIEMKTMRDNDGFCSFSDRNQTYGKQNFEVHKCTDNSKATNNMDYVSNFESRTCENILLENGSENNSHCSLSSGYVRADMT